MLSKRAVTVWMPLTDVSEDMGSLRVVVGSHDRIWPVELRASMIGEKGTGHKAFHLADADVDDLELRSVPLVAKAGDIALPTLSFCIEAAPIVPNGLVGSSILATVMLWPQRSRQSTSADVSPNRPAFRGPRGTPLQPRSLG